MLRAITASFVHPVFTIIWVISEGVFIHETKIFTPTSSILAAYDLGATAGMLQKIYDEEAAVQRPIYLDDSKNKDIVITTENWTQFVGNIKCVYDTHI